MALKIKKAFRDLCRPLTKEERDQLEANILGVRMVREEILTWNGWIIDGHNRYEIATQHSIPYDTAELQFENEAAALNWIIHNQLGRRNLNPDEASYLRGKLYNAQKADKGGDRKSDETEKSKVQNEPLISTAAKVAEETGVSESTIKRDAKKAEALDKFPSAARDGIRAGTIKATDAAILKAGKMEPEDLAPVWRAIRTEGKSLDEALGMGKKKPPVNLDSEPPEPKKRGQPTKDVRLFAELEKHIGKTVRMNTAIKEQFGFAQHHETIRVSINDILGTLATWKKQALA